MDVLEGITPFSLVLLLGATQGAFLSIALLTSRRGNTHANAYLCALLVAFSVDLIDEFMIVTGYYTFVPVMTAINWAIDLLFGPFIFLYTRRLTEPDSDNEYGEDIRHFVPFFIAITMVGVLLSQYPMSAFSAQVTGRGPALLGVFELVLGLLGIVSMAIYLYFSLLRVKVYRDKIQDRFSYVENINLVWLQVMLLSLLGLLFLYVLSVVLELVTPIKDFEDRSLYPAIVIVIYIMGFMALKQPQIFFKYDWKHAGDESLPIDQVLETADPGEYVELPLVKYAHSAISKDQSALILADVQLRIQNERLYLDNSLTLPKLASHMRLSPNILSQCINEVAGMNFFDFVNRYRVDEAKRRLCSTQENILHVALSSGFNSKTAFYSAFKKSCQQTPGEYRRSSRSAVDLANHS